MTWHPIINDYLSFKNLKFFCKKFTLKIGKNKNSNDISKYFVREFLFYAFLSKLKIRCKFLQVFLKLFGIFLNFFWIIWKVQHFVADLSDFLKRSDIFWVWVCVSIGGFKKFDTFLSVISKYLEKYWKVLGFFWKIWYVRFFCINSKDSLVQYVSFAQSRSWCFPYRFYINSHHWYCIFHLHVQFLTYSKIDKLTISLTLIVYYVYVVNDRYFSFELTFWHGHNLLVKKCYYCCYY